MTSKDGFNLSKKPFARSNLVEFMFIFYSPFSGMLNKDYDERFTLQDVRRHL